jgi:NAD-dependent DNA ligase (contains BRCT domain type II)
MQPINDIADLFARLNKADEEYHSEGESSITDAEYDRLRRMAQNLDPTNPYFDNIGSDVRGGKEKLPYQMGSLDQVYDQKDWQNWVTLYDLKGKNVVVSDKQDGISVLLMYHNGRFDKAYSRGNGLEGADYTRHVKNVPSVPKTVPCKASLLVVRAELIMPVETFNNKYLGTYKNPRNMVSGCFNRSVTEESILADVECITYQVVAYQSDDIDIGTKTDELEFLRHNGFVVTPYVTMPADSLSDALLKKLVISAKSLSTTELDGVVVTIDDYNDMASQRKSQTSLNPEHSIKYKVSQEGIITEVKDVIWEISKSGFFKPRVQIRPIHMGGVTITYATGFNGKFIFDNGIGPGAQVKITRSGDVIPYITDVVQPATAKMPTESWDWNDSGVEIVVTDDDHPVVKFKQVLSFVESLEVELLKESSLETVFDKLKLVDKSYEVIILTLFDMLDGEWASVIGANGNKIAQSIQRRGANMTHELFLGAVKYLGFGFGVRKAKALLAQISYDELLAASVEDIAKLDGFDTKTAEKIVSGLKPANDLLEKLIKVGYVTMTTVVKTSELKGVNVVFTGFRDADLEKAIELAGGKVGSSVSSKTTHLLTADPKSNSGKAKKAKDLGVSVITPEQFKDDFNL